MNDGKKAGEEHRGSVGGVVPTSRQFAVIKFEGARMAGPASLIAGANGSAGMLPALTIGTYRLRTNGTHLHSWQLENKASPEHKRAKLRASDSSPFVKFEERRTAVAGSWATIDQLRKRQESYCALQQEHNVLKRSYEEINRQLTGAEFEKRVLRQKVNEQQREATKAAVCTMMTKPCAYIH